MLPHFDFSNPEEREKQYIFFPLFFRRHFLAFFDLLPEGKKECLQTQAQARNKMPLKEGEAAPNVRNSSDAVIQSMPMPMLSNTALH
jgi:hypothetical protein